MGLVSDNSAYTAVQGVFLVLRRRVSPAQGMAFASVLPVVPRAIFMHRCDIDAGPAPFGDRAALTAEAQALRPYHNTRPANCIEATARALWRSVDHRDLDRVLSAMAQPTRDFRHVDAEDPSELAQRIV